MYCWQLPWVESTEQGKSNELRCSVRWRHTVEGKPYTIRGSLFPKINISHGCKSKKWDGQINGEIYRLSYTCRSD